ncbi:hypothetical protein TW65_03643 [Stemphylium lycopersici]|nr:hypothetical protein TW65_03643 [Stemphylium lycopersici]
MSSQQGTQGPLGASRPNGPPYAPQDAGLGGSPSIVPDVPISVVFLIIYLMFGVIHIRIFKGNKHRGHKFIFNGALLGLCKIRVITMIMRIVWANYPRNVGLAISANIFTYIGTIILYILDWFFVQRIIRAQHPSLGWSTPYRIFHRAGLVVLISTLLGLIISQIWKFFTLDQTKIDAFKILFLIAQTYFTAFCFAPIILVIISLLIPRTEVDKFGAGRLRYNITILIISVCILSIGQVFRCVLAWIPPTPMLDVQRGVVDMPWYLSKASFYCFNFVTEIFVVIMFAIVRVDLRFYVPNGARKSGDYSRSRLDLQDADEKNTPVPTIMPSPMLHSNGSSQTLHRYQSSVFEDTQTLADSLRYPHSTLEVDERTGNWKVKRLSGDSARSRHTAISFAGSSKTTLHASSSRATLNDRAARGVSRAPPVPELPAEWPLPDAAPPQGTSPVLEHINTPSRRATPGQQTYELETPSRRTTPGPQTYELENHQLNDTDVGDAVIDALSKLEMNSEKRTLKTPGTPPPGGYRTKKQLQIRAPKSPVKSNGGRSSPKKPIKYTVYPPNQSARRSRAQSSPTERSPVTGEAPYLLPSPNPAVIRSQSTRRSRVSATPSLEIISLLNHMSGDQSSRIRDASLLRAQASASSLEASPMTPTNNNDASLHKMSKKNNDSSTTINANVPTEPAVPLSLPRRATETSSNYSNEYSPSNEDANESAKEHKWAQAEFQRFSDDAPQFSSP